MQNRNKTARITITHVCQPKKFVGITGLGTETRSFVSSLITVGGCLRTGPENPTIVLRPLKSLEGKRDHEFGFLDKLLLFVRLRVGFELRVFNFTFKSC